MIPSANTDFRQPDDALVSSSSLLISTSTSSGSTIGSNCICTETATKKQLDDSPIDKKAEQQQVERQRQEEQQEEIPSSSSYASSFSFVDDISRFPQELVEKVDWITQCHNPIEYLQTLGFTVGGGIGKQKLPTEEEDLDDDENDVRIIDNNYGDPTNDTTTPFVAFQIPLHCEYCGEVSTNDCNPNTCRRPTTFFSKQRPPFYNIDKWRNEGEEESHKMNEKDFEDDNNDKNTTKQQRRRIHLQQPYRPSYTTSRNSRESEKKLDTLRRNVPSTISASSSFPSSSSRLQPYWISGRSNTSSRRPHSFKSSPIIFSSIPEEQQSAASIAIR
jgi:hypothetical protein